MLITNPSYRKILSNNFFPILISGSMFLPPTTVAGATLYSVAVYGGLVLFSMFLLYDTQKVIKRAEVVPMYRVQKYDPISSMLGIDMDTLNIFMRVATVLATSGNRKK